MTKKQWEYVSLFGKWRDLNTKELGFPKSGDWYLDGDEWRIW